MLVNMRRVDLSGSRAINVRWLYGTAWQVATLVRSRRVLNISRPGLKALPKSFGKLEAIVAMNTELDGDVVSGEGIRFPKCVH